MVRQIRQELPKAKASCVGTCKMIIKRFMPERSFLQLICATFLCRLPGVELLS